MYSLTDHELVVWSLESHQKTHVLIKRKVPRKVSSGLIIGVLNIEERANHGVIVVSRVVCIVRAVYGLMSLDISLEHAMQLVYSDRNYCCHGEEFKSNTMFNAKNALKRVATHYKDLKRERDFWHNTSDGTTAWRIANGNYIDIPKAWGDTVIPAFSNLIIS